MFFGSVDEVWTEDFNGGASVFPDAQVVNVSALPKWLTLLQDITASMQVVTGQQGASLGW